MNNFDFSNWFIEIQCLARAVGEIANDTEPWKEAWMNGQSPETAFYEQYPQHDARQPEPPIVTPQEQAARDAEIVRLEQQEAEAMKQIADEIDTRPEVSEEAIRAAEIPANEEPLPDGEAIT